MKWQHLYGGVYRSKKFSFGHYEVEQDVDSPKLWRPWFVPLPVAADPNPRRISLGFGTKTATESRKICQDHFWAY
jgi:hypothetical protein